MSLDPGGAELHLWVRVPDPQGWVPCQLSAHSVLAHTSSTEGLG